MPSLYRKILKKAWFIAKKHLYLWPLGFFVAFLGNGGEYQVLIKQVKNVRLQPETIYSLKSWLAGNAPNLDLSLGRGFLTGLFIIIALVLFLLIVWLIISSVAGLIEGSAKASLGEKGSFRTLLLSGSKKFGPVLGLYVIARIIVYGVLALILAPLMVATFAQGNYSLNVVITILSFLIFIPLVIIVSFVTRYASAFVVLESQRMWQAFKNGWRLFAANWLISLEMAFVLLVINLLVGIALFLVAFLIFSPFFFIGLASSFQTPGAIWNVILIPLVIIMLLTVLVGSGLATFQTSSWTLLYLRLTEGGKAYSKIVRWVAMLPGKFKKKT